TAPLGVNLSGTYTVNVAAGSIVGLDGNAVPAFSTAFAVADTIAPRVTNTTFSGRFVTIQFSEAMRASTITRDNVILNYLGPDRVLGTADDIALTADLRTLFAYDPATNRALIDLSDLPQSLLPNGDYALVVKDAVTDGVGNQLDGEFEGVRNGVFPSGDGVAGGTLFQFLRDQVLQAPLVSSLGLTAASDTGVPGDANTDLTQPIFSGQLAGLFPAAVGGVQVAIQFSGLHGGGLDLAPGFGGRGFTGNPDLVI